MNHDIAYQQFPNQFVESPTDSGQRRTPPSVQRSPVISAILRIIFALAIVTFGARAQAEDISDAAVRRADAFLSSTSRGEQILSYVHFGAAYKGHNFLKAERVKDTQGQFIPGRFTLIYEFAWDKDGITDIAFRCDSRGSVYKVYVTSTNAIVQQPFLFANGTIQALGNLLIGAYKDQMTENQAAQCQKFVDNADAKGMLELSLQLQQGFGN